MKHIVYIDSSTRKISCHDKVSESALAHSEILILNVLSLPDAKEGISRDEIIAYAWPGKVVTKNSLNVAMNNIRNTLNELNVNPSIITLRGYGYQLHHSLIIHQVDSSPNVHSIHHEGADEKAVELIKRKRIEGTEIGKKSIYINIHQTFTKISAKLLNGYKLTVILITLIFMTVSYYFQMNLL
ncbi:winged helix-turn-helix domain-containing protein [Photobacterium sp. 1_MG-2023]|uniref:winged helix-turn-helix domain-containing protein n=1 Tax=Photobacterium sp. 1_MG-2023 TaxID=3062646 RepID=UPI0026E2D7D8|nr:winged helix-turn-helix domain-containing protein [Photobacterium sp. 1_MG-2023]MDO6705107.1 winged helix-turn-helix domain-containing protein [Photobacterium sp. 1_MG-2023]